MTRFYYRDGSVWDVQKSLFEIHSEYEAAWAVSALNTQAQLTQEYMNVVEQQARTIEALQAELDALKPAEIVPANVIDRVHVSFWQQGARAGKFSSGAYEVISKPREGFVTIQLMDDKQLTVSVDRTRSVA